MCQFKAKDSEAKPCPLCLGNISKYLKLDNMKKKTGLKESVWAFPIDYNPINTSNTLDIHEKYIYIIMFGIVTKRFIVLLASLVNASNHTKCVPLSNQKY